MAYRKKLLHHRIKMQAADSQDWMGGAHPAVPAPMLIPLTQVTVYPADSNYVTMAMESLAPITTADGAMIPASSPGKWDQLKLAGGGMYG